MRYLLVFLVGCLPDIAPFTVKDAPELTCEVVSGNTCEAAHKIAASYCGRLERCDVPDASCFDNVVKDLCRESNCASTYDNAELDKCLMDYDAQPCDVRPSVCKLH